MEYIMRDNIFILQSIIVDKNIKYLMYRHF